MPITTQAKLLKVIETGQYRRVGSIHDERSNFRLVSATNKDLRDEIKAGRFREDFFARISVVPVYLPPLRDRLEDIIPLAEHFLSELSAVYRTEPKVLDFEARAILLSYRWPWNVRELKAVMSKAVVVSRDKDITGKEIQRLLNLSESATIPLPDMIKDFERALIIEALRCSATLQEAASKLEITRRYLQLRLIKLGLKARPYLQKA